MRIAIVTVWLMILASSAAASEKYWLGEVSDLWSNSANWHDKRTPANGESLAFAVSNGAGRTLVNDLVDLRLGAIRLDDRKMGYVMTGNSIRLSQGMSAPCCADTSYWDIDLVLDASQKFAIERPMTYASDIDINGHALTFATLTPHVLFSGSFRGDGILNLSGYGLTLTGTSPFRGTVNSGGNVLKIDGSLQAATIYVRPFTAIIGRGTVGNVFFNRGYFYASTLTTGNLTLVDGSFTSTIFQTFPRSGSEGVRVNGRVHLDQTSLHIDVVGGAPVFQHEYIVIANDGSDPVEGFFRGLREGAHFQWAGYSWRISYRGGDGNDVTLVALEAASNIPTLSVWGSILLATILVALGLFRLRV